MAKSVVMTLIGEDRPGLVESVANLVAAHGGNWLESRMSRLGGHFAGILRAEVPPANEPALVQALRQLEAGGLQVVVHPGRDQFMISKRPLSVLEIVGQDRPGIVRDISRALAEYGVNVEELHTGCLSAAMSGETLFKARAVLSIPESCQVAELRNKLETIAEDLFVDVSLEQDTTP